MTRPGCRWSARWSAWAAARRATDDQGQFRIADVAVRAGRCRGDRRRLPRRTSARRGSAAVLAIRLEAAGGVERGDPRSAAGAPSGPPLHLDTAAVRNQPGAGNDVLRALQSLPGVARTPFGLGGLALRGTAPRDTKVYLDDIEVPLLYHFGGIASFLPTARGRRGHARARRRQRALRPRAGRRRDRDVADRPQRPVAGRRRAQPDPARGRSPRGPGRSRAAGWSACGGRTSTRSIRAASVDLVLVPRYGDAQLRWESGDGRWMAILFGSDDLLTLLHDPNARRRGRDQHQQRQVARATPRGSRGSACATARSAARPRSRPCRRPASTTSTRAPTRTTSTRACTARPSRCRCARTICDPAGRRHAVGRVRRRLVSATATTSSTRRRRPGSTRRRPWWSTAT